ncbi:hypothetical protein LDENG_00100640 [Lucifuga dentata]|nr:hypothetical protein LDENG_00100640 [Lucifuga dentata]
MPPSLFLQHRFYFDQVFGEESSNEEVYHRTAYPLVQHMLNGGKATCFAYGQTGAGKTHTMLGSSPGRPGLYALAARDIFAHLSTIHTPSPLLVYVSFFEIYCGQLYDLLDHRKRLFAREDGQKVVHIAGLNYIRVDSINSLLEVISQGTEERTQGVSGVNPLSSRSHALLQIQLRGPKQQIAGRLWFVDLAGSERASDTKEPNKHSRMEGAEINQSLLALKECIRSLDQEQAHTPFRQSKLTQVLKDSFVGDSKTCMIANISPGHLSSEHTLNTLRYANRVKELRGQAGARGRRTGVPPSSTRENELQSAAKANGVGFSLSASNKISENPALVSTALTTTLLHAQVQSQPEVKAKMPVLPPQETSEESLNCTMDPLSISLLQVDQQAATASFLQGKENITYLCPPENEWRENNRSSGNAEMAGDGGEFFRKTWIIHSGVLSKPIGSSERR